MEKEGVIKFQLNFTRQELRIDKQLLSDLNQHRRTMMKYGLVGQDQRRYEGYGFGNISIRSPSTEPSSPQHLTKPLSNTTSFWISGTQTGHLSTLGPQSLARVESLNASKNTLHASGQQEPSSESMTHGVIYQASPNVNAVIHIHSPDIWRQRSRLGLQGTHKDIPYGTPEMADAVASLASKLLKCEWPILFCMDGHEDGIVAAGSSLYNCAELILTTLNKAQQLSNIPLVKTDTL